MDNAGEVGLAEKIDDGEAAVNKTLAAANVELAADFDQAAEGDSLPDPRTSLHEWAGMMKDAAGGHAGMAETPTTADTLTEAPAATAQSAAQAVLTAGLQHHDQTQTVDPANTLMMLSQPRDDTDGETATTGRDNSREARIERGQLDEPLRVAVMRDQPANARLAKGEARQIAIHSEAWRTQTVNPYPQSRRKGKYSEWQEKFMQAKFTDDMRCVFGSVKDEIVHRCLADTYLKARVATIRRWIWIAMEVRGTTPWRTTWNGQWTPDGDPEGQQLMLDLICDAAIRYTRGVSVDGARIHVEQWHLDNGFAPPAFPAATHLARKTRKFLRQLYGDASAEQGALTPSDMEKYVELAEQWRQEAVDKGDQLEAEQITEYLLAMASAFEAAGRVGNFCPGTDFKVGSECWTWATLHWLITNDPRLKGAKAVQLPPPPFKTRHNASQEARDNARKPLIYLLDSLKRYSFANLLREAAKFRRPVTDPERTPAFRNVRTGAALSEREVYVFMLKIESKLNLLQAGLTFGTRTIRRGRIQGMQVAAAKGFGRVAHAHHDNDAAVRDVSTHTTARGMAPYSATSLGGRVELLEQADREHFEAGAHMFRFAEYNGGIAPMVTVRWLSTNADGSDGHYCTVLEPETGAVSDSDEAADSDDAETNEVAVTTLAPKGLSGGQTTLEAAFQRSDATTSGETGTDDNADSQPTNVDDTPGDTGRGGAQSATMPAEPAPTPQTDGWAAGPDAILPMPAPNAYNWAAPAVHADDDGWGTPAPAADNDGWGNPAPPAGDDGSDNDAVDDNSVGVADADAGTSTVIDMHAPAVLPQNPPAGGGSIDWTAEHNSMHSNGMPDSPPEHDGATDTNPQTETGNKPAASGAHADSHKPAAASGAASTDGMTCLEFWTCHTCGHVHNSVLAKTAQRWAAPPGRCSHCPTQTVSQRPANPQTGQAPAVGAKVTFHYGRTDADWQEATVTSVHEPSCTFNVEFRTASGRRATQVLRYPQPAGTYLKDWAIVVDDQSAAQIAGLSTERHAVQTAPTPAKAATLAQLPKFQKRKPAAAAATNEKAEQPPAPKTRASKLKLQKKALAAGDADTDAAGATKKNRIRSADTDTATQPKPKRRRRTNEQMAADKAAKEKEKQAMSGQLSRFLEGKSRPSKARETTSQALRRAKSENSPPSPTRTRKKFGGVAPPDVPHRHVTDTGEVGAVGDNSDARVECETCGLQIPLEPCIKNPLANKRRCARCHRAQKEPAVSNKRRAAEQQTRAETTASGGGSDSDDFA